ncbi:MAG: DUF5131 family protein [Bryobacteraceae bacterium]
MLKKSAGNMYPWVTHTKSYLRGKCPHECSYCYVQAMAKRFPNMRARYGGQIALDGPELSESLGDGRTIFVEHLSDLFAEAVTSETIHTVLNHCRMFWRNTFVFQSKNPVRYFEFLGFFPMTAIWGTTIETNRHYPEIMRQAPPTAARAVAMECLRRVLPEREMFITIEPILDFDLAELVAWLTKIRPTFVNIGADSKGHGLKEPAAEKVRDLIAAVTAAGIEIRQKTNLARLLG